MRCQSCDGELKEAFRFCPWCAAPQRTKLVEHFPGHPQIETEPLGLRVSRYLADERHVRISIWDGEQALAAISLEEREAVRLAAFVGSGSQRPSGIVSNLRSTANALRAELERALREPRVPA